MPTVSRFSRSALRARAEWQFFGVLWKASPGKTLAWWAVLVLQGAMPALLAIATGWVVGTVRDGSALAVPLTVVGVLFVLAQVLPPLLQAVSAVLGAVTADWLSDRLMRGSVDPPGMAHLESAELATDLAMARDFDLGRGGPPLRISMEFIAIGLAQLVTGVVSAAVLFGFSWWAPPVLLAVWASTHWLLRESGVWKDRNTPEVRDAQRHAAYAYDLAVEPPAAKELRLFGLGDWVVDRFSARRQRLFDLQYAATRLRERPLAGALLIVLAGNTLVFWALTRAAFDGTIGLGAATTYLQAAVGASAVAFGGLSWALDMSAAPAAMTLRLPAEMARVGALAPGAGRRPSDDADPSGGADRAPEGADRSPDGAPELRLRDVTFGYGDGPLVLDHVDLTVPAGTSMAVVGVNGAGKTTLAKLVCRLYDPLAGAVEVGGVDIRELDVAEHRSAVTAVFQDFIRYELPLRDNVAPRGADDELVLEALSSAGAAHLTERSAGLGTVLARGYDDGTDLSGGQWQRVALARALTAVRQGARIVLLDEPTAALDVRGESEIFERILAETRGCTTILVSHRFSTVRKADRICVLEHGRVAELGTHDELMALGGRYRTMFDLQAARFTEVDERGEEVVHDTLD
ncbi:MAG TPA: ABC transporter ATP-binding protein [Actinomycetes bacterium]|nr:ABC transporter ATP-binding protein [Actinomycetes bacterium]